MCINTSSSLFIAYRLEVQALLDGLNLLLSSLRATLVVGSTSETGILDLRVELNLRLGTRRTNRNLRTILAEPLQHVRGVRHVELCHAAVSLLGFECLIVLPQTDLGTTKLLRRISAEVGHHLLDFISTALTWTYHVDGYFLRKAVLLVDVHQQVVERHTIVASPCGNLTDQTDSCGGVLIPYLVVRQEAERLLTTTDILLLTFVDANLIGNPLEARVAVLVLYLVLLGNLGNHLGGHRSSWQSRQSPRWSRWSSPGTRCPSAGRASSCWR